MKIMLAIVLLLPGFAHAAELRVLTAGAYRAVLVALAPAIKAETGHTLVIQNETAGGVVQKVRAGEPLDLAILPPDNAATLGTLIGPARNLARVGIGIAVKDGAPKPPIATEADIRAAILAARAPAWIDPAAGGSSGIYMTRLVERWGITAQVAPRVVLVQGGLVADRIADNRADLAFQQLSELNHTPGVVVVGMLPAAIQNYTVYAGAVPASSTQRDAAAAVLAWLSGPHAAAALPGMGMEAP